MAGTKYTRKPSKPIKKSDRSITTTRDKKTGKIPKQSNLKKALKGTAKGLGKGAMAVASMSPAGKGVKAAKLTKKAYKAAKRAKDKKEGKIRGPGSLPKKKSTLIKGDFKYKKNLEKRIRDIDDKPLSTATKKRPGKVKEMTKKRAQKELDLLDTDMTYEERAKILGGFKKGGAVKSKCKIDGIAQRGRTRAKRK